MIPLINNFQRGTDETDAKHAVRLIGYGTFECPGRDDVKYWLAANSWGTDFGDKGVFRIVRGKDESGIEERMSWGSVFFPF
jgi:cathepsin B